MAVDDLLATSRQGLSSLQDVQRDYDEVGWRVADSEAAKLRHIVLHLARTLGTLASLAERHDHLADDGERVTAETVADDLRAEGGRIADLVAYAAQLSTLADRDLGELFERRLLENASRWAPDSGFAEIARQRGI